MGEKDASSPGVEELRPCIGDELGAILGTHWQAVAEGSDPYLRAYLCQLIRTPQALQNLMDQELARPNPSGLVVKALAGNPYAWFDTWRGVSKWRDGHQRLCEAEQSEVPAVIEEMLRHELEGKRDNAVLRALAMRPTAPESVLISASDLLWLDREFIQVLLSRGSLPVWVMGNILSSLRWEEDLGKMAYRWLAGIPAVSEQELQLMKQNAENRSDHMVSNLMRQELERRASAKQQGVSGVAASTDQESSDRSGQVPDHLPGKSER